MKRSGWMVLAAIVLIVAVILSYRAGYKVGADMAERDNASGEGR